MICRRLTAMVLALGLGLATAARAASEYAVVASTATSQDAAWAKVIDTLKAKHQATVILTTNNIKDCREPLKLLQPRFVCFVARPEEIDVTFVRRIHVLSRAMDEDPYTDFLWGIITGITAEDALRIAKVSEPLVVKNAMSTTGVHTGLLDECLTLSDGKAGNWTIKTNGVTYNGTRTNAPMPAHERFLNFYNSHRVDLFVTSGHATEVNLELPFSEGALVAGGDKLYAVDKQGLGQFVMAASGGRASGGLWFQSPGNSERRAAWAKKTTAAVLKPTDNPKIFIAAGNCLIGDVMKCTDSEVMIWLSRYGVNQFVGYTVATWYGKAGWGTLGLWQESGGQWTLSEAFYLNTQRLIERLVSDCPKLMEISLDEESVGRMTGEKPGPITPTLQTMSAALQTVEEKQRRDLIGMLYDRDSVALYGDPKWEARADRSKNQQRVTWSWTESPKQLVLTLQAAKAYKSGDAFVVLLPKRSKGAKVTADAGLNPMLSDEFIMIPKPVFEEGKSYRLEISR